MKPGELPKQIDETIAGVVNFLYGLIGTFIGIVFRPVGKSVERLRRRRSAVSSTTYLALVAAAIASISTWGHDAVDSLRATGHIVAEQKDGLQALVIRAMVIYAVADLIARLAGVCASRRRLRRRLWAAIGRYAVATSLALVFFGFLTIFYALAPGPALETQKPDNLLTLAVCFIAVVGMLPGGVALSAAIRAHRPRASGAGLAIVIAVILAWFFCIGGVRGFVKLDALLLKLTEPAPEVEVLALHCQSTPPDQVEVWAAMLNKGGAPAVIKSNSAAVTFEGASGPILLSPVDPPLILIKPGQTAVVRLRGVSSRPVSVDKGGLCELVGIDKGFRFSKVAYRLGPLVDEHASASEPKPTSSGPDR